MNTTVGQIEKHALVMRRNIIKMVASAGSGHPASSLGLADIFAALYFEVLNYNPKKPDDPKRDILVLSAGHVVPAQYAALAEVGLIPQKELLTLRKLGSRLQGHPERESMPWMETTSGPLGSGLSQAAGMAWVSLCHPEFISGSRQKSHGSRIESGMTLQRFVYCITGDGELNEGNIWEGAMFASKYKLGNLIVIVDRNNIQLSGDTEEIMPLENLHDKWESFGWQVIEIDGNNIESFINACSMARAETEKPSVIIAHTTPGKGVSYMEDDYLWHGTAPDEKQAAKALEELK